MAIDPLLERRRSLRAIDPARPLSTETIERLLEAARWAPSCSNMQPWRFVVVTGEEALVKARAALKRGNQTWANSAPLLIIVCANPADDATSEDIQYYLFDCGLAVENLLLQGIAEGLVMHPMAGFDHAPMREAIALPEAYKTITVIAAGYPGPLESLPEDLQQRETGPRARKPLAEIVHYDTWTEQKEEPAG